MLFWLLIFIPALDPLPTAPEFRDGASPLEPQLRIEAPAAPPLWV